MPPAYSQAVLAGFSSDGTILPFRVWGEVHLGISR